MARRSPLQLPDADPYLSSSSCFSDDDRARMLQQLRDLRVQQETIAQQQKEHLRSLQDQVAGSRVAQAAHARTQEDELKRIEMDEMRDALARIQQQQQDFQERTMELLQQQVPQVAASAASQILQQQQQQQQLPQQTAPPPPPPPPAPPSPPREAPAWAAALGRPASGVYNSTSDRPATLPMPTPLAAPPGAGLPAGDVGQGVRVGAGSSREGLGSRPGSYVQHPDRFEGEEQQQQQPPPPPQPRRRGGGGSNTGRASSRSRSKRYLMEALALLEGRGRVVDDPALADAATEDDLPSPPRSKRHASRGGRRGHSPRSGSRGPRTPSRGSAAKRRAATPTSVPQQQQRRSTAPPSASRSTPGGYSAGGQHPTPYAHPPATSGRGGHGGQYSSTQSASAGPGGPHGALEFDVDYEMDRRSTSQDWGPPPPPPQAQPQSRRVNPPRPPPTQVDQSIAHRVAAGGHGGGHAHGYPQHPSAATGPPPPAASTHRGPSPSATTSYAGGSTTDAPTIDEIEPAHDDLPAAVGVPVPWEEGALAHAPIDRLVRCVVSPRGSARSPGPAYHHPPHHHTPSASPYSAAGSAPLSVDGVAEQPDGNIPHPGVYTMTQSFEATPGGALGYSLGASSVRRDGHSRPGSASAMSTADPVQARRRGLEHRRAEVARAEKRGRR